MCNKKAKVATKKWCKSNKKNGVSLTKKRWNELKNKDRRNQRTKLRLGLIQKLGGKCVCCGETHEHFLQVDHVNGDGNAHRRSVKGGSAGVFRDLLKNPGKYEVRVLCANCHNAITFYGSCPHESLFVPTASTT